MVELVEICNYERRHLIILFSLGGWDGLEVAASGV